MKTVNFRSGGKFPMFIEALERLQDIGLLVGKLAGLGGANYILEGCTETGDSNISDGIIVVNGELLQFVGGVKQTRITVIESRKEIEAFGVTYPEVYIDRYAQFSATGEILWDNLKRIETLAGLSNRINDITGDPAGTVKMWAGLVSRISPDYMLCNGAELSVESYPQLFQNIGNAFGGNGQTTFNLPDLRNRFIVGYDSAQESDYSTIGAKGGQKEVALTTAQLPAHDHTAGGYSSFNKLSARASDIDSQNTPSGLDAITGAEEYRVGGMSANQWTEAQIKSVGDNKPHENRPPYFVLAYIIKVK